MGPVLQIRLHIPLRKKSGSSLVLFGDLQQQLEGAQKKNLPTLEFFQAVGMPLKRHLEAVYAGLPGAPVILYHRSPGDLL